MLGMGVSIPHTSSHFILTALDSRKQSLQEPHPTLSKFSHSCWLLGSPGKCLEEVTTIFRYLFRTYSVPDTELVTFCMLHYSILTVFLEGLRSPFYSTGNGDSLGWSSLPTVTQLISVRARIHIQVFLMPKSAFSHLPLSFVFYKWTSKSWN